VVHATDIPKNKRQHDVLHNEEGTSNERTDWTTSIPLHNEARKIEREKNT
jgi:hypothetical protein